MNFLYLFYFPSWGLLAEHYCKSDGGDDDNDDYDGDGDYDRMCL
jgi:hypothetical protein